MPQNFDGMQPLYFKEPLYKHCIGRYIIINFSNPLIAEFIRSSRDTLQQCYQSNSLFVEMLSNHIINRSSYLTEHADKVVSFN